MRRRELEKEQGRVEMTVHAVPEADDKSELYLSTINKPWPTRAAKDIPHSRKIVAVDQWENRLTLSVD